MNILFVVVVPFPFGDASSIRAYNLCKLIHMAGNSVHVISDYPTKVPVDKPLDFCTYEDCASSNDCMNLPKASLLRVKEYISTHEVDAVLTNARYDRFDQLVTICKKNKIRIYVENCEWYDSTSFKLGKMDPRFWMNEKMIRYGFRNVDGFISISSYLDKHNKGFGKKSVRIPTILDVKEIDWTKGNNNSKVTLVYAGSLGKSKELLGPIIATLAKNKNLRDSIVLHIYGPSKDAVSRNIKSEELLIQAGESVQIHGRVPQTQVPEIMSNADFVFFMRPYRRSSHAGFPTKLGESMSVGTPVITNNTGDINTYIQSGENGYIISSLSEEDVYHVLEECCSKTAEDMELMRRNARRTAEKSFDYRNYVGEIKELFSV